METEQITQIIEQEVPDPCYTVELQRITAIIQQALNPEYILLFGTLAGGTPHSELMSYDILAVTPEAPRYNSTEIKRYIRLKIPLKHRKIPGINIYIHTLAEITDNPCPSFYLAHSEGQLLYNREFSRFGKPTRHCNYEFAYRCATGYFSTLFNVGSSFLESVQRHIGEGAARQAGFCPSQAAILFYRTLFVVYHGYDIENTDIELLHRRLRTILVELNLLLDPDNKIAGRMLHRLTYFQTQALYNLSYNSTVSELSLYVEVIEKMKIIVNDSCRQRIEMYRARITQ